MRKFLAIILACFMMISLVACTTDGGSLSQFSTKIGGEKYTIKIADKQGYSISNSETEEGRFVIYKSGEAIVEYGVITSGLETSMAKELINREDSEYTTTKDKATFYAFEQYDTKTQTYTILIKYPDKPSFAMFTMEGSMDDVKALFDVMSVK